jgi:hypothetical protein
MQANARRFSMQPMSSMSSNQVPMHQQNYGAPSMAQQQSMRQSDNGSSVDEFYGIDDFLPTPMEAMVGGGLSDQVQLCDAARRELAALADRFHVDPDTEQPQGIVAAVIVKCNLSASHYLVYAHFCGDDVGF